MDDTVRTIEQLTDAALGRKPQPPPFIQPTDIEHFDVELHAVREHVGVDAMPDPPGGHRWLKRIVLRLAAFNWSRQRAANHAVANSLELLMNELQLLRATSQQLEYRHASTALALTEEIDAARRALETRIADLRHTIDDQRRRTDARITDAVDSRVSELNGRLEQLALDLPKSFEEAEAETRTWLRHNADTVDQHAIELAALRADLLATGARILATQRNAAALRSEVATLRIGGPTSKAVSDAAPLVEHGVDELYSRFEAAFRPSDTELQQRFEDYLDVLDVLTDSVHPLIDIGAGRGEFVAMLSARGIKAIGVDLNADAVTEARKHDRPVELAEAVAFLGGLADESVSAVTAFHVVEHLPADVLLRILDESLRVLRPGGLLIFETPNPTNLVVGAAAFYHDPTHLRPVTPTFMEFLVRDRGFTDINTRFLHALPEYDLELAAPEGRGGRATKLLLEDLKWALKGPQDYAVLARRPAAP